MVEKRKGNPIGWCTHTWNPIVGCSKISPGCAHCYAETMAIRHIENPKIWEKYDGTIQDGHWSGLVKYAEGKHWTGKCNFIESELEKPFHRKQPRRIFVCSMGDLFHENVPLEWVDRVMEVIDANRRHKFLFLTKRAKEMAEYMKKAEARLMGKWLARSFVNASVNEPVWPLPNLALGVTAENQEMADLRMPILLGIPAAVRFVSIEPMLGPIDLSGKLYINGKCNSANIDSIDATKLWLPQLHWVISGGENGPGARTFSGMAEAIINLKDQCVSAGVPFFYKGPKSIDLYNVRQKLRCFTVKGYMLDGVEYRQRPAGW